MKTSPKALGLFLFFWHGSLFPADIPNCSDYLVFKKNIVGIEDVQDVDFKGQCRMWYTSDSILAEKFDDGTGIINLRYLIRLARGGNPKLLLQILSAQKPHPDQEAKLKRMFQQLKEQYLSEFKAIKSSQATPVNLDYLAQRIYKLRFKYSSENRCRNTFELAPEYDVDQNIIYLCKNGLGAPIESLIPILAHEIGHAADPCHSHIYKYTPELKKIILQNEPSKLLKCGISSESAGTIVKNLKQDMKNGSTGIYLTEGSYKGVEILSKCKLVLQPEVAFKNFENYLWGNLKSCLSTAYPSDEIGFDIDYLKMCGRKSAEAFADHIGAKITAAYIQNNRQRLRPKYAHTLLSYYVQKGCLNGNFEGRSYPSAFDRLNIFLNYSEIQEIVKCRGLKNKPICTDASPLKSSPTKLVR